MKRCDPVVWGGCALLFFAGAAWSGVLPETDFLIKIKKAEYTFMQIQPQLENLIQTVNQKLEK